MAEDTSWYQQALTPPDVFQIDVRIGCIPETDHVQALVELKDPTTGILLAQASYPHAGIGQHHVVVEWAMARALVLLEDVLSPF